MSLATGIAIFAWIVVGGVVTYVISEHWKQTKGDNHL